VTLTMKTIPSLVLCLVFLFGPGTGFIPTVMAANSDAEPLINLTVNNQPLGDVLDTITAETGYQFKLNDQWEAQPVSATIVNLPLEQGLKRLLRSLNHTIIWESDRTITIMVYGKSEAGRSGGVISHAAPPQSVPEPPPPYPDETVVEADDEQTSADETTDANDREIIDRNEEEPTQASRNAKRPRIGRPPALAPPAAVGGEEEQGPPND
jgi:hypothetical protein